MKHSTTNVLIQGTIGQKVASNDTLTTAEDYGCFGDLVFRIGSDGWSFRRNGVSPSAEVASDSSSELAQAEPIDMVMQRESLRRINIFCVLSWS